MPHQQTSSPASLRAVSLAIIIAGATSTGCASTSHTWQPLPPEKIESVTAEHPGAEAVVLSESYRVDFILDANGQPAMVKTNDDATLLLSENARRRFGRRHVYYSMGLSKVTDFRARILHKNGKVEEFGQSQAHSAPAYRDWILYSGSRALSMPFPAPAVGSVVESHSVKHKSRANLFSSSFYLGVSGVPALSSSFEVCRPKEWAIEHMVRVEGKPTDLKPSISTTDDTICERWEAKNVAASAAAEEFSPGKSPHPEIIVRLSKWKVNGIVHNNFRDAKQLSAWEHREHYAPMRQVTPEIEALATNIVKDVPPTQLDRASALYSWVRDNVTYCAIELGMGGWKPYPSTKVHSMRYGDCKDKATYLSALMKSQGIASRPAGIYSHDGYPRPFTFPVLGRFNHAILVVDLPSGPVVIDPTTRTVPFGRLPISDEGAPLLPASDGGSEVFTTPIAPPDAHRQVLTVTGALDDKGVVTGTFHMEAFGTPAWSFRHDLLTTPEGLWKKAAERSLRAIAEIDVLDATVKRPEPTRLPSTVVARGKATLPLELAGRGEVKILRLSFFAEPPVPRIELPRRAPVVFGHNKTETLRASFSLPAGLHVSTLPKPVHLDTPMASYDFDVHLEDDGRRLAIERTLVVKQPVVVQDDAEALSAFLDAVWRAENEAVVFRATPRTSRVISPRNKRRVRPSSAFQKPGSVELAVASESGATP